MKKLFKVILSLTAAASCALTLSACSVSASSAPPDKNNNGTVTKPADDISNDDIGVTVTTPNDTKPDDNKPDNNTQEPSKPGPTAPEEPTPENPPTVTRTATFMCENEVYATIEFEGDEADINFPEVPQKPHYASEWTLLKQEDLNLIFTAAYIPLPYYLAVLDEDGNEITTVEYTAETTREKLIGKLPPPPQKPHYFASWSDFTPFGETSSVHPEYEPIIYKITFTDANGEMIAVQTYTVENAQISEPVVPELEGYENGRWENYELDFTDITVSPVYDKAPDPNEIFTEGLVFTLNEDADAYEITGYDGAETDIKVPSVYNGKRVTAIGDNAFCNKNIAKVTVAEGITAIKTQAFLNCSVAEVILPKTLEFIGKGAFNSCTQLQELTIPDGVTTIESMAFANCTALKTVTVGANVTMLPQMAFFKCTSLQTVILTSRNTSVNENAFSNCPLFKGVTYLN